MRQAKLSRYWVRKQDVVHYNMMYYILYSNPVYTYYIASSPGYTHFSMLHVCNIEKWVWPGDEATYYNTYNPLSVCCTQKCNYGLPWHTVPSIGGICGQHGYSQSMELAGFFCVYKPFTSHCLCSRAIWQYCCGVPCSCVYLAT